MTDAKRAALVGLGLVSSTHLAAIDACPGVDLVMAGGRDLARTRAAAGDRPVAVSTDPLIVAEAVDLVILATPPDARDAWVAACCEAGTPILMEKPVERDLARATALVERCEAAGVALGIVLQHRMRPSARRLKAMLDDGALGALGLVEVAVPWWRDQSYYDTPGRGTFARDGGGVLISQAIHTLDLMLHLAGPAARCQAMLRTTRLHEMEAEDLGVIGLDFASGAVGSVVATTAARPGGAERIALHGARGSAVLEGDALTVTWSDGSTEAHGAAGGTGGGADPMAFTSDWHRDVLADFVAALDEGRAPAVTGRDALAVHALIDAAQRSSAEGRAVAL